MRVHAPGDGGQARGAVVHGVHRGHHGQEHLRGADVGGGLLAADVLLTGLQREPVGPRAVGVDAHADQPTRHGALEAGAHAHEAGVRATEPHRHAEALAVAHGDVGAPLPRRRGQGQGEQVGGGRDQGARLVGGRGEGGPVAQLAVGAGVLHQDTEDRSPAGRGAQALGVGDPRQVGHHDVEAERPGPGRDDGDGLRQGVLVDQQHGVLADLAGPAHQRHRLGGGRALVQQRGARGGQAGQVHHDGLEVQQRLEPALGDLRLVRRVGGVPGGVLQHVAAHHRRRQRAVVAQTDHRGQHRVAGGQGAQLGDHRRLARRGVDGEGALGADDRWQSGVEQGRDAGLADDLEHRGDVRLVRADVARDEVGLGGGGGVGGHERLLTRAAPPEVCRSGLPPHLSPEVGSRVPARAVLAPERFRGGLPLRRPVRSTPPTLSWVGCGCAGTLPHGVDQHRQPNIRGLPEPSRAAGRAPRRSPGGTGARGGRWTTPVSRCQLIRRA